MDTLNKAIKSTCCWRGNDITRAKMPERAHEFEHQCIKCAWCVIYSQFPHCWECYEIAHYFRWYILQRTEILQLGCVCVLMHTHCRIAGFSCQTSSIASNKTVLLIQPAGTLQSGAVQRQRHAKYALSELLFINGLLEKKGTKLLAYSLPLICIFNLEISILCIFEI